MSAPTGSPPVVVLNQQPATTMLILASCVIVLISVVSAAILFHVGARRGEDRWMYAWTGFLLGPFAFLLLLNGRQSSSHRL